MSHGALWCVEMYMHRPEVAILPLLVVCTLAILAGGGRRRP